MMSLGSPMAALDEEFALPRSVELVEEDALGVPEDELCLGDDQGQADADEHRLDVPGRILRRIELVLEVDAAHTARKGRRPEGRQYLSAGQGMGEVLTMAGHLDAYTLTDRATYGAYRARIGLDIVVEGDARMFNPYGVIAVNPARYPDANFKGAMQFIEWLAGEEGRRAIAGFRVNGEQLFFPAPG